jgi:hypothetical protein
MLIDAKLLGIDARSLVATRNAEKLLGVDLHGADTVRQCARCGRCE